MKNRWLLIMALLVAITGCGGGKKADQSAKGTDGAKKTEQVAKSTTNKATGGKVTGTKKTDHKAKVTAEKAAPSIPLQHMEGNKQDVVIFLTQAEHVVHDLQYAAASTLGSKEVQDDAILYRQLPEMYDTRDKILAHIENYWNRSLAVSLYNHLDTKIIDDKVYLSLNSHHKPVMITPENTKLTLEESGLVAIVTENGGRSAQTITYKLERDRKTGLYQITKRIPKIL
ncbi:hypothetical protein [Brevibacillus daliensis]|uniref:hypothetical protein n=1 Tax=Brevibacillus daliensis TaxID=2892995 RepID=UPI001E4F35F1|nr:hypothetical protein [Brevibacillus daliensis]